MKLGVDLWRACGRGRDPSTRKFAEAISIYVGRFFDSFQQTRLTKWCSEDDGLYFCASAPNLKNKFDKIRKP
jgi:hypothetical protein